MTNAEKALEAYKTIINQFSDGYNGNPYLMDLLEEFETYFERALKIAAAVDGDGLVVHNSTGNNDLLERLRGIK